jgi:alcohol dehydrogenase class IV
VDHCVEGPCSLDARAEASASALEKGLRSLVPSLLQTKADWEALERRLRSMMGVVEAVQGLKSGLPMGGSHGIGHQLGPLGVGHGETSCILLPAVLKYNYAHGEKVSCRERYWVSSGAMVLSQKF